MQPTIHIPNPRPPHQILAKKRVILSVAKNPDEIRPDCAAIPPSQIYARHAPRNNTRATDRFLCPRESYDEAESTQILR